MILLAAALCIASVHDGDTIRTCQGERVRLEGIDAPEVRGSPRCSARRRRELASSKNPAWCDFTLGAKAQSALSAFLRTGRVQIHRNSHDRYGRTVARVSVSGQDAGQYLVHLGVARRWQ